jgi:putative ATPase
MKCVGLSNALGRDASATDDVLSEDEGSEPLPYAQSSLTDEEQYLSAVMQGLYFYTPRDMGYERTVAERLAVWRERDAEESVEKRARRYAGDD